ncbi:MAG: alpha/beta hydrolase [Gammaproteobacteria bacterium]
MINNDFFPTVDSNFVIKSPEGQLELAYTIPKVASHKAIAVICHPHPVFGGTMGNKVVTTLARMFNKEGIPAIRFNFRGVGQSSGSYAEGIGEADDLRTVLNWVKITKPDDAIYLAGFSFGSYIAARVSHEYTIKQLISIAPPVNHFDFDSVIPPKAPWLIVQGTEDEVVPAKEVFDCFSKQTFPHKMLVF